jgi:hypothetical protein
MESAWIKVFVLTLTQCMAPAGKMVCQMETVQYQFAAEDDCNRALAQMIDVAAGAENVIVSRDNSHCRAAAIETEIFSNVEEANTFFAGKEGWGVLTGDEEPADFTQSAHQDRLKNLHECAEVANVAPCKVGEIIIEAAADGKKTEVWQQQK